MANTKSGRFRRTILSVLIVLAMLLCNGCSYLYGLFGFSDEITIPFSEMEYVRPDLDALKSEIDTVTSMLSDGSSLKKTEKQLQTVFELYNNFHTMMQLSCIHYSIDTTDAFYIAENAFFSEAGATCASYMEELYKSLAKSDFCEDLEKDLFGEGTLQSYLANTVYTDDVLLDLFQQEAMVFEEYRALMSEPTVLWNGIETPIDSINTSELSNEQYSLMIDSYADKYNKSGAEIYIRLIKIRHSIAEHLGYDSYEQYCYDTYDRSYTPQMVYDYATSVVRAFSPLYLDLVKSGGAEGIRLDSLSENALLNDLDKIVSAMNEKSEYICGYMRKFGLCDASFSTVKENTSYTTYLPSYEAPFIFLDAEGSTYDILSLSHEFGHFCDAYINSGCYESLDLAETFSQAFTLLALPYLTKALTSDQASNLTRVHLMSTIESMLDQCFFNEFEHQAYLLDNEALTVENLNRIAASCADDYGFTDQADAMTYYTKLWVTVPHLYQSAFYVISYSVSMDAAFQLYQMEINQSGSGVDKYFEMIYYDIEQTFTDCLTANGLTSPFDIGRADSVVKFLRETLMADGILL